MGWWECNRIWGEVERKKIPLAKRQTQIIGVWFCSICARTRFLSSNKSRCWLVYYSCVVINSRKLVYSKNPLFTTIHFKDRKKRHSSRFYFQSSKYLLAHSLGKDGEGIDFSFHSSYHVSSIGSDSCEHDRRLFHHTDHGFNTFASAVPTAISSHFMPNQRFSR